MKGILLAGGQGTRLFPSTKSISKQLLPVYDKPAIYYPLSILMLAGIKEILIISTPRDTPMIEGLLGPGVDLGLKLSYQVQQEPKGIAQAILIGEKFIGNDSVCLVLGDNLFYGHKLGHILRESAQLEEGAEVFGFHVNDPENFGVVAFDDQGEATSLEEKPQNPKSNWAVTGLYFYDSTVVGKAKTLKPSARGELEITDLNRCYLDEGRLRVKTLGRGVAWLDMGNHESLVESAQFVQTIEKRQGLKISCIEEVALIKGFISKEQFDGLWQSYPDSSYTQYLKRISEQGHI